MSASTIMSCWSPPATAPPTGPADVDSLPESVKQMTWFSTRQLFFVDLALPLQLDMEQVEDEDTMYLPCVLIMHHLAGGSASFSSTGLFFCVT